MYVLPVWDEIIDPTARYRHPEGIPIVVDPSVPEGTIKYTTPTGTYIMHFDPAKPGTNQTVTQGLYESMQLRLKKQQEFALRRIGLGPKK